MHDLDEMPIAMRVLPLVVPVILVFTCCIYYIPIVKEIADNRISLGTEVQTTDEYELIFNESFEGNIIEKHRRMYTVRDANGTERTVDRHWLERVGGECDE